MYFTNPHATLTQNSVQLFGDMNTFATNASLTAGPTFSLETAVLLRYLCSVSALGGTTRLTWATMLPSNLTLEGLCNLTLNPNLRQRYCHSSQMDDDRGIQSKKGDHKSNLKRRDPQQPILKKIRFCSHHTCPKKVRLWRIHFRTPGYEATGSSGERCAHLLLQC